jgi:dynein heavy chain
MIPGAEPRIYAEVDNMENFVGVIEEYLEGYNDRNKKKQMKLVMFLDACTHVSRICRILRQPRGNSLCLGVGGSGRQSLCKLAAYVVEYEIHQIEITKSYNMTQWHDDLKEMLKYAGIKNDPICFLFVDT